jgi:hypothetical protein
MQLLPPPPPLLLLLPPPQPPPPLLLLLLLPADGGGGGGCLATLASSYGTARFHKRAASFTPHHLRENSAMLTPITAVGGVNSKIVCRNKDVFYLKENIIVHDSIPDLVRTVVVGPLHQPCSVTSFDVVGTSLAVAYRTLTGPHVELHQLSASHSTLGVPSQITGIGGIEICDVAFSDDGRRLAVLTSLPDFSVMVFDTASKQRQHCLNLVIPANCIAFSAVSDSQVLVHGSGIVQIVDFAAAPPSVLRCEYVDGNTPLTAHSACFGAPHPLPCLLPPSSLLHSYSPFLR